MTQKSQARKERDAGKQPDARIPSFSWAECFYMLAAHHQGLVAVDEKLDALRAEVSEIKFNLKNGNGIWTPGQPR